MADFDQNLEKFRRGSDESSFSEHRLGTGSEGFGYLLAGGGLGGGTVVVGGARPAPWWVAPHPESASTPTATPARNLRARLSR